MICSNCSQPSVLSLSEDPLQFRVIFPVPAAGPGCGVSSQGKLWPGPVLQDYRWPIARPIRSGPHWLGSDQWTNQQPAFADTDWKLWLCLGQAVDRGKQGHTPLLSNLEMHQVEFTIKCENVNHYWESNGNWIFCSRFHVIVMNAEMLREINNKMFSSRWYCSNWLIHQD